MKASQFVATAPEVSSLARTVAANLMRTYDVNASTALENSEVASAQQDAYKAFGRVFVPTQFDVAGYGSTLDMNHDGRVTQADLERICERYIGMWAALYPAPVKRVEEVKKSSLPTDEMRKSTFRKQFEFIRRLFEKFDVDHSGYIGAEEVKALLEETYKVMGITRSFNLEDVASFMKMMDKNIDGKITYDEYEDCLIKSLNKRNINIA